MEISNNGLWTIVDLFNKGVAPNWQYKKTTSTWNITERYNFKSLQPHLIKLICILRHYQGTRLWRLNKNSLETRSQPDGPTIDRDPNEFWKEVAGNALARARQNDGNLADLLAALLVTRKFTSFRNFYGCFYGCEIFRLLDLHFEAPKRSPEFIAFHELDQIRQELIFFAVNVLQIEYTNTMFAQTRPIMPRRNDGNQP